MSQNIASDSLLGRSVEFSGGFRVLPCLFWYFPNLRQQAKDSFCSEKKSKDFNQKEIIILNLTMSCSQKKRE